MSSDYANSIVYRIYIIFTYANQPLVIQAVVKNFKSNKANFKIMDISTNFNHLAYLEKITENINRLTKTRIILISI